MNFNTVSIVKHEFDLVWNTMRDELPQLVYLMDDIESITMKSRGNENEICEIVNIWQSSPPIPQNIADRFSTDMFCWTDYAQWNEQKKECAWRIEHHHFRDIINCQGTTSFSPAMGGRGTRITFTGDFSVNSNPSSKILGSFENSALKIVETMLKNLIPKNFRKLVNALSSHIQKTQSP